MNEWKQQGTGLVGPIQLKDGARGRIVLVGPRSDPEGAMVVVLGKDGASVESVPFAKVLDKTPPAAVVKILCAQERQFGESRLPTLEVS